MAITEYPASLWSPRTVEEMTKLHHPAPFSMDLVNDLKTDPTLLNRIRESVKSQDDWGFLDPPSPPEDEDYRRLMEEWEE